MNREENAAFNSSIHGGINPLSILDAGRLIGDMRKNNILYSAGKTLGLSENMDCGQAVLKEQDCHSLPELKPLSSVQNWPISISIDKNSDKSACSEHRQALEAPSCHKTNFIYQHRAPAPHLYQETPSDELHLLGISRTQKRLWAGAVCLIRGVM